MTLTTREAQEYLTLAGLSPGPIDGIPGPRTTAAVRAFQAGQHVEVDGIVGPITSDLLTAPLRRAMAVPDEPPPADPREALLTILLRWQAAGCREVGGQNRGPWVRAIVGAATGVERDGSEWKWCGYTLMAAAKKVKEWTGADLPDVFSGSTVAMSQKASALGRLEHGGLTATRGDLVLYPNPPGSERPYHHVEAVLEPVGAGGRLRTIGGNTGDALAERSPLAVGVDVIRMG